MWKLSSCIIVLFVLLLVLKFNRLTESFDGLPDNMPIYIKNDVKPNLILDDGGATRAGDASAVPCNLDNDYQGNVNQIWRYDSKTKLLHSANKMNLCLDDGGWWPTNRTNVYLANCQAGNPNQSWDYDSDSKMLYNPRKKGAYLDDGGSDGGRCGMSTFKLNETDGTNANFKYIPIPQVKKIQ
jgi:hypothetical protein